MMNKIEWATNVSMFRNRIILQGLGLSLGTSFGIIFTIIMILTKGDIIHSDAKYALLLIVVFLLLSFLLIFFLYGGKYTPVYIIDENGITNYSQQKGAKINTSVNALLIVLGVVRGNFISVGAAHTPQSRQFMNISWDAVQKVKYYPKQNAIVVKDGFTEKISIFCTLENYLQVAQIIKTNVNLRNNHHSIL